MSSLVRYDDSSLAAIRHVQSIVPVVRPRPNIRSHSVLLGTVFPHNFTAELIMGPKFSVFIFVLCLYGVMVSQARLGAAPPSGLHDIKKSPKYRRSIENILPLGASGRKFRENDVNIAD